jgi:hypothetical protein
MGDCHLKAIEDTENIIILTSLAVVVAIFIISTPLLPFKSTISKLGNTQGFGTENKR